MKKYDLSQIMSRAWQLYRKGVAAFAECLHRAWMAAKAAPINAQRIEESRQAFGVTEEVHTWADWRKLGFEVVHGSRCLFQCLLIHATKARARPTAHRSLAFLRCSRWRSSNTDRRSPAEPEEARRAIVGG